jgi:hypothetical protein
MKELDNYIIEKLHLNKNIKSSKIDEKDFEYKFVGLNIKDFFKWYTGIEFNDAKKDNIEEFIDNSTFLEIYYNTKDKQLWCSNISAADFMRIKHLLSLNIDEEIELYQKYDSQGRMYDCTFEVSFLDKPITFYSMDIYDGKCDIKYNL